MKKEYETPIMELEKLEVEDIITTSSKSFNPDGLDLDKGDPWYDSNSN